MISVRTFNRAVRASICLFFFLIGSTPTLGVEFARPVKVTEDGQGHVASNSSESRTTSEVEELTAALPLSFEPNVGQADSRARFVARTKSYGIFLTDTEAVLSLPISRPGELAPTGSPASKRVDPATASEVTRVAAVRMRFEGASTDVKAVASHELPGKVNYLRGNDPAKWQREVPTYASVGFKGIYEGVDAVFYGTQEQLEYDVVVHPGADPSLVRISFEGQESVEVTSDGDLVLGAEGGELRHLRAGVYQHSAAGKMPVSARYELDGPGAIRFAIGEYDRSQPLIIDPSIEWSRFLGGSDSYDEATAVAVDSFEQVYLCGTTNAFDFPTTPGAYSTTYLGGEAEMDRAIFVMKLSSNGRTVLYSTYIDGSSSDIANDIEYVPSGAVIIAGQTWSSDFPTTPSAYDTEYEGGVHSEGFVAILNQTGEHLAHSTYLGGTLSDAVESIALGPGWSVLATGWTGSPDFPTTPGAFDTTHAGLVGVNDGFVARLAPDLTSAVFSTYLGGSAEDSATCVAVSASSVYVGGVTGSPMDFPITPGSFQQTLSLGPDGFVAKFSLTGSDLEFCSYLGGHGTETLSAIVATSDGACVVGGDLDTRSGFPVVPGSYESPPLYGEEFFCCRVEADGTELGYAAIIGGDGREFLTDMTIDFADTVYLVGASGSENFPFPGVPFDTENDGTYDALVCRLGSNGTQLLSATFFGGSSTDWANGCDVEDRGRVTVCGMTGSPDLLITDGAFQPAFAGQVDGFLLRLEASGNSLRFSTYLGGTVSSSPSNVEFAGEAIVSDDGSVVVVGSTGNYTFPTTDGAFDRSLPTETNAPADAFVTKINSTGTALEFSTFVGGSYIEWATSCSLSPDGSVIVSGGTFSVDFPTTPGAVSRLLGGQMDGFVARLSPSGSSLVFGTYLGGVADEYLSDTTLGADGSIAIVGETRSADFPTTAGAFDTTFSDGSLSGDGFVSVISNTGSTLLASTFLGEIGYERVVAVESVGQDYVIAGHTTSPDFPTTPGALDVTFGGGLSVPDAFVSRIRSDCSDLQFSTFLGGSSRDYPSDLDVGHNGELVVVGSTSSLDFPTTAGAFERTLGTSPAEEVRDAFVSTLDATGSTLLASSFIGDTELDDALGVHVDQQGRVAVVGWTESQNFPVTPDAFDTTVDVTSIPGLAGDGFVTLMDGNLTSVIFGTFVGEDGPDRLKSVDESPDGSIIVAGDSTGTAFLDGGFGRADLFNVMIMRIRLARLTGIVTPAVYVGASGAWFLRNSNSPGPADMTFSYGPGGSFAPIVGDWDGDGDDTVGIYDSASGAFFLRNSNGGGAADVVFTFGAGGAGIVALAGDWNGDGTDTIGLYVASTGVFFLRNSNSSGPADSVFSFGAGGAGILPIVGDWNGDGADSIGLYAAGSGTFFLRNVNAPGGADLAFSYGPAGAVPLTGDWNGDGSDTVGIYVPATGAWFLRDANSPGGADVVFSYGPPGATPIVGNWDGI